MSPAGERVHSLDAVRALAMFLGIFLHASLPYSLPGFPWPIFDQSRSVGITIVVFVIHAFRMPAFFLVAGFFARTLFVRIGFHGFVRHRLRRILLPLTVAWIAIFPLVRFAWAWGALSARPGSDALSVADVLRRAFSPPLLLAGLGFGHLWFLYYLLVIYGVFLAARALLLRLADPDGSLGPLLDRRIRELAGSGFELPALALPTTLLLLPMRSWGIDSPNASLLPQARSVLLYLAFFAFGWMMSRQHGLLEVYASRWLRYGIVAVAAVCTQLPLLWMVTLPDRAAVAIWLRPLFFANYAVLCWAATLALIGSCARFLAHPNRLVRYAADASYWMYLVHLPIVLLAGFVFARVAWPWPLELLLVHALVIPVLLGSYHTLVRFTWVGVLLNGRRVPRLRPASPPTDTSPSGAST